MASGRAFREFVNYACEQVLDGQPVSLLMCNGGTWNDTVGIAQVLASELVEINGYQRVTGVINAANFDPANLRTPTDTVAGNVVANGGTLVFDTKVAILNGSANANRELTAIDAVGNTLTCPSHALTENEAVVITTDTPGTQPGGIGLTTYYAGSVTADTFTLLDAPGGSVVDIADAGSLGTYPVRLRYAKGQIAFFWRSPTPISILDTDSYALSAIFAFANAGFGQGV